MSDEIIFCDSPEDVADAAADLIFEKQTEAVADRGVFRIALSGGTTPGLLYKRLASAEWRDEMSWDHWEVYWSDERAVPPDHPDSNFRLAYSAFLSKVPVRKIFPMFSPTFTGGNKGGQQELTPEQLAQAAHEYGQTLKHQFGPDSPVFDLILLGVGADGHTASLFPHSPGLESGNLVEVVDQARTFKSQVSSLESSGSSLTRLTLTLPVLNSARTIAFLITGEEKAQVVKEILELGNRDLPATLVNPPEGECYWILDDASAELLE